MNKVYTSLILVFGLVVLWTIYLTNIREDKNLTVRYYTIKELTVEEKSINKVKIGGLVKPNSIDINLYSIKISYHLVVITTLTVKINIAINYHRSVGTF